MSHHCKETILTTAIDPANEKKRGSGKVQQNNRIVDAKYLLVREEAFSGNRWRERERQRERWLGSGRKGKRKRGGIGGKKMVEGGRKEREMQKLATGSLSFV